MHAREVKGTLAVKFTTRRSSHGKCTSSIDRTAERAGAITVNFSGNRPPCSITDYNFQMGGHDDGEFMEQSLPASCRGVVDLDQTFGGNNAQVVFKLNKDWKSVVWRVPLEYTCSCKLVSTIGKVHVRLLTGALLRGKDR